MFQSAKGSLVFNSLTRHQFAPTSSSTSLSFKRKITVSFFCLTLQWIRVPALLQTNIICNTAVTLGSNFQFKTQPLQQQTKQSNSPVIKQPANQWLAPWLVRCLPSIIGTVFNPTSFFQKNTKLTRLQITIHGLMFWQSKDADFAHHSKWQSDIVWRFSHG